MAASSNEVAMSKFQVRVLRPSANETEFVRALRLIGRVDLTQAHELAMHLTRVQGTVVVAGVDLPVADHIAATLNASGAQAQVEPSSIDSPMLCAPAANVIYEWGALRTVRARKAG
jgi:hypothetical protein